MNSLTQLQTHGQALWLDYIRRDLITGGDLERIIGDDGLRGMTSNPKIFDKAITESEVYEGQIRSLALRGRSIEQIYDALSIQDVKMAADAFRSVYDNTDGIDGYVSLEVSPYLAHDTERTIEEARRLWADVNRPNVLIKVPATLEGLPAIRELISEGVNVNVTLLFGLDRYRQVAEAYLAGIQDRVARNEPVGRVASVASFFLSRIDVLVDAKLEAIAEEDSGKAGLARELHGHIAISSARIAYQYFKEIFGSRRFAALSERGARPQRLLWASTSTKNPEYSDVKYVEALIAPQTVNTLPLKTLNAYRDHGKPEVRIEHEVKEARERLDQLADLGIDIHEVTQQLEDEGIEKFVNPFANLMRSLKQRREAATQEQIGCQRLDLGTAAAAVESRLIRLRRGNFARRIWRRDPLLWSFDGFDEQQIARALGWLDIADRMVDHLPLLTAFRDEVKAAGLKRVVHIGMGGSSLAPLLFERTFDASGNGLPLMILDTTDPLTIARVRDGGPLDQTLFIVASKSGTTAETRSLADYFFDEIGREQGDETGRFFAAITDPGSPLVPLAQQRGFRRVFLNDSHIGGRYSALSYFGLVPAALMGVDVEELLIRAMRMSFACGSSGHIADVPALTLGAALGELALRHRDKLTLLVPEVIAPLGLWLEQLVAESTGKLNRGLLPIEDEELGAPDVYTDDRIFVQFKVGDESDPHIERKVAALREEGWPVITIQLNDRMDVAQEFFRWEFAIAVAGAVMDVNPFNQPDVQQSKDNTERLLQRLHEKGRLPSDKPVIKHESLTVDGDLEGADLAKALSDWLGRIKRRDYVALQAYLPETATIRQTLNEMRLQIRDALRVATTVGFGPRYLHSTGQFHKGGPAVGHFVQLTADCAEDVPVPDNSYGFSSFQAAQALGDRQTLQSRAQRVVHVHLGKDIKAGLNSLVEVIEASLSTREVAV